MKMLNLSFPYVLVVTATLSACATDPGYDYAAERAKYMQRMTKESALLDAEFEKRAPADCSVAPDVDAVPLVRFAPTQAKVHLESGRSGSCAMRFDINSLGEVVNLRDINCTDDTYVQATRDAVSKWTYKPAMKNGVAVSMCGISNRAHFKLLDDRGALLPGEQSNITPL